MPTDGEVRLIGRQCGSIPGCADCTDVAGNCPTLSVTMARRGYVGGWIPLNKAEVPGPTQYPNCVFGPDCSADTVYRHITIRWANWVGLCGAGGHQVIFEHQAWSHAVLGDVYKVQERYTEDGGTTWHSTLNWEVADTLNSDGTANITYSSPESPITSGGIGGCRPTEHVNLDPPMYTCEVSAGHLRVSCHDYPGDSDPCDIAGKVFLEVWLDDAEAVSNAMGKALAVTSVDLNGTGNIWVEDPSNWTGAYYSIGLGAANQIASFLIANMRTPSGIRPVITSLAGLANFTAGFGQDLVTAYAPGLPSSSVGIDLSGGYDVWFLAEVSESKVGTFGDQTVPLESRTGAICKQSVQIGFDDACHGIAPNAKLGNETYWMGPDSEWFVAEEHSTILLAGSVAGEPCASADPPCIHKGILDYGDGYIYGAGYFGECGCVGLGIYVHP